VLQYQINEPHLYRSGTARPYAGVLVCTRYDLG